MTNTMATKSQVQALLWQAITPIHPGTGQVSASVIDLPVAREGATGFPVLPASSIKGVLRGGEGLRPGDDKSQAEPVKKARQWFGYADHLEEGEGAGAAEPAKRGSAAGDLSFTDARLLALSVPSYRGTFALVTCPMILCRLRRDQEVLGVPAVAEPRLPQPFTAFVSENTVLRHKDQVILQDLDLRAEVTAEVGALAQFLTAGLSPEDAALIAERLCVVSDDVLAFLSETATEVTAHVRLEPDKKTVVNGALWYEETIPAETLFTSFVISKTGEGLAALQGRPYLQIGGKGSVGRGLLRVVTGGTAVTPGGE